MADYSKKKAEWLEKNGFNSDMVTYIYFPNDSYSRKEELKAAGFRFNGELLWHCAYIPEGYEEQVIEMTLDKVGEITAWGQGLYNATARQLVTQAIKDAQPIVESTSNWIGSEKERLRDILVKVISIREMNTRFGFTQLIRFETEDGDVLNWWTATNLTFDEGDTIYLTGTVKKFDEYNGEKVTVLTRCKAEEV